MNLRNKTGITSVLNRKSKIVNLKSRDGYVLVVIIGILTILSLMAITFATLSRIETRATRNYTDSVKCEQIAKAALEHAIYVLRQDKFGYDNVAYDSDPPDSPDENYDWSGETWWPGNVDLANPITSFAGTDTNHCDNDGDKIPDSKWIYFPVTATTGTNTTAIRLPGNLLARYAVLITDDREARVNINVSGNQPGDEGTSTTEIDMSSVIAPDGSSIANEIISKRSTMPFGILTESEIVGIAGTSTAYTSRLEKIFQYYTAVYEDHKGTLTAYSADTITCPPYQLGTSTATTMLNINALVNNEGAYTDTAIYGTDTKVNMILDVLTKGNVQDVEHQQMAVNIKDFIDSDNTVTNYTDLSGDTYYGVDKSPYINEVEAEVDVTVSFGNGKFIELFNPYDTPLPIGNWKIEFGTTTIILPPAATIPAQDYYVIADTAQSYVTHFQYNNGLPADRYDPNINNLNPPEVITLKDSNNVIIQKTTYGQAAFDVNTRQLNDPRPTPLDALPSDPWLWATSIETAGGTNTASIAFDPSVGSDGWDNTTWPNSFLVANRRFSNKGYMGFIHRGSQWSSFKLDNSNSNQNVLHYITITDPSMDNIDNDGDGAIDSTDTGIQTADIDGKEQRIPGLINVNTAPEEVLKSLPIIGTMTAATDIATNGSKPYKSIKDLLVKITNITDTSASAINNKWNREKRFRSISNLITTRSNVFTVYVTAQLTDETGKTVAEKRIQAIVDRSVEPIKIRYFRWVTE